jgi:hypothetical protein
MLRRRRKRTGLAMQNDFAKPTKIVPRLPHPALPGADWADCYRIAVGRSMRADEAARLVLGRFPYWVKVLITIRDALVAPFGIKPSTAHKPGDIDMIGIFPVVSRSARQVVLGFDDRHLDFRAVIDVNEHGGRTFVSSTTLVRRKVLFGKLYLMAITPFHNLIVETALINLNRAALNPQP